MNNKRAKLETFDFFPAFPKDVKIIVLSWLDLKTFFQSRRVCKLWNNLIVQYLKLPDSSINDGIWHMCQEFIGFEKQIFMMPPMILYEKKCECQLCLYLARDLKWEIQFICLRPTCLLKTIVKHYFYVELKF